MNLRFGRFRVGLFVFKHFFRQPLALLSLALTFTIGVASVHTYSFSQPVVQDSLFVQSPGVSCGPACLYFLIDNQNWNGGDPLPEPACFRPDGWTLHDLADSARAMHWSAGSYKADWSFLKSQLTDPDVAVILHVDGGHYVLAFAYRDESVWIYDPRTPSKLFPGSAFENVYNWDGVMLILRQEGLAFGEVGA